MKTINWKGKTLEVQRLWYSNARPALVIYDPNDPLYLSKQRFAVASVNEPNKPLGRDEVLIKNWSENEGILDALVEGGIVEDTGRKIPMGFVDAVVCRVLVSEWRDDK